MRGARSTRLIVRCLDILRSLIPQRAAPTRRLRRPLSFRRGALKLPLMTPATGPADPMAMRGAANMGVAAWPVLVGGGAGLMVGVVDVAGGPAIASGDQACLDERSAVEVAGDSSGVADGGIRDGGCRNLSVA